MEVSHARSIYIFAATWIYEQSRAWQRVRNARYTHVPEALTPRINIPSAWLTPVSQIANAVAPRENRHDPLWKHRDRDKEPADSAGSVSFGYGNNAGPARSPPWKIRFQHAQYSRLIR